MRKTYSAKPTEVTRKWYVLDASKQPLGRLATQAASLLLGKAKPQITPHIDCGDYVIVINAATPVVTGDKLDSKKYYRHSGYPGGLKTRSLSEQIALDPTVVITKAVRGMLPVNKLRDGRLARLKIYAGADHTHAPQQPEILTVKEKN
jgi:large subunit ribosomal protein L13